MNPITRWRRLDASARLGVTALFVLWALAVVLSAHTYTVLAGSRTAGDSARAQLIAQSVAQRLARAVSVGIPLDRLAGVPEMLRQREAAYDEVESILIENVEQRPLWRTAPRHDRLLSKTRTALWSAPQVVAVAPIVSAGRAVGSVHLVIRSPDLVAFMGSVALPLTMGCFLFAGLAWLAARAADASGAQTRERAVRLGHRDLLSERFDRVTTTLHRRAFDLRAQQLARAVRSVHEQVGRGRRVIGSLRRTEPHPTRRKWLDELLAGAEGRARFAAGSVHQRRVVASDAQGGWVMLMLACSAGGGLALAGAHRQEMSIVGQVFSLAALASGLAWIGLAAGWLAARRVRAPAGGLVLAASSALALTGWLDRLAPASGLLLVTLITGAALGTALAACVAVQQATRLRSDLLPLGRRPWMPLLGLLLGLVGAGPALAGLVGNVSDGAWRDAVPTVPAMLAAFSAWRWDAARSPWRVTPSRGTAPPEALPGLAVALAVGGLVAVQLASVGQRSTDVTAVATALAAGIGLLAGLRAVTRGRSGSSLLRWTARLGLLGMAAAVGIDLVRDTWLTGESGATDVADGWMAVAAIAVDSLEVGTAGVVCFALAQLVVRRGHAASRSAPIARWALAAAAGALIVSLFMGTKPALVDMLATKAAVPAMAPDAGALRPPTREPAKDNRGT